MSTRAFEACYTPEAFLSRRGSRLTDKELMGAIGDFRELPHDESVKLELYRIESLAEEQGYVGGVMLSVKLTVPDTTQAEERMLALVGEFETFLTEQLDLISPYVYRTINDLGSSRPRRVSIPAIVYATITPVDGGGPAVYIPGHPISSH